MSGASRAAGAAGRRRPHAFGLLLLAAITLIWGVNWPAIKLAVDEVPVWTFRAICLLTGGLGLLALCRLGGLGLHIPRADRRPLLWVTLLNVTGWHLCSAAGVVHMAAGRASIIAFTMPLWAALFAVPALGERLTPAILGSLAVGLAGIAVLVVPDWQQVAAAPLGPLFMLAAAVSWAAGTVGMKCHRWHMPVSVLAGWQLLLGGVPVVLGALWLDRGFDPGAVSATGWLATAFAAILPMIFCQWAWFRVVALYPAAIAAIGTLAIPVVGVLSSALVLGEPIGFDVAAALALVCAALAIALFRPAEVPA